MARERGSAVRSPVVVVNLVTVTGDGERVVALPGATAREVYDAIRRAVATRVRVLERPLEVGPLPAVADDD